MSTYRHDALQYGLALSILAIATCDRASSPTGLVVWDSSGVRIVEISPSPWTSSAFGTIRPQPIFDIGDVNGPWEYQFDHIIGVVRLRDGSVVVADAGSGQIRMFDGVGKLVSATGQPGGGPGEYRQIASMGLGPGDSLWVYDFGARRFTVLDKHGDLVRTVNMGTELANIGAVGRLTDGSFVIREYWSSRLQRDAGELGLIRTVTAVARVTPTGQLADTIGLFLGREVYLGTENGRGVMSAPPFAHTTNLALRADTVLVGEQSSFEVKEYTAKGRLQAILRTPDVELRLSEADVAAYIEHQVSSLPPEDRAMRRRYWESLGVPETRPAYGDLKVDRDGNLWIAEYVVPDQPARRWVVFGPDGSVKGLVLVPARFTVYDIGRDWIVGVWRDELDVEHVQMYELARSGA